jgi:hypothetical protein
MGFNLVFIGLRCLKIWREIDKGKVDWNKLKLNKCRKRHRGRGWGIKVIERKKSKQKYERSWIKKFQLKGDLKIKERSVGFMVGEVGFG